MFGTIPGKYKWFYMLNQKEKYNLDVELTRYISYCLSILKQK